MKKIKITTYNTHLFLSAAGDLLPEYEDETRLDKLIWQLLKSQSDIVTLTEVWANSIKEKIIARLKSKFPRSCYCPKSQKDPTKLSSGLLILSKFKIIDGTFTQFKHLVNLDAWTQKGFIQAKLMDGPNTLMHLIITHTQSGNSPNSIKARRSNFQQIYTAIKKNDYDVNIPFFVTGDFNVTGEYSGGAATTEYTEILKNFSSLGLIDSYRTLNPQAKIAHGFTYNGYKNKLIPIFEPDDYNVQQRIDYIFLNKDAANIDIDEVKVNTSYLYSDTKIPSLMDISDHYPLDGKFSLTKE